jgi:hypothetical protein
VPHLATCISLFFYNESELGVGMDPGMALTPLPSSIGQGSNPQPSDRESSALPLDHSFRFFKKTFLSDLNPFTTKGVVCEQEDFNIFVV